MSGPELQLPAGFALALMPLISLALDVEYETDLALESRWYFEEHDDRRSNAGLSVALEPELFVQWNGRSSRIVLTPFARWDSEDDTRSHLDIRQLYFEHAWRSVDLRAGISSVFWGKTEILHLVDIINQDDGVENIDGEDKLGQPMVRLNWLNELGALQLFVLPLFRERSFPGPDGRLGPVPAVDTDRARYAHADEDEHLDWAVRFQGHFRRLNYGLAYFSGTTRDPQLVVEPIENGGMAGTGPRGGFRLVPYYGLTRQTSLDAQLTLGSWLLKLEAVYRDQDAVVQDPEDPQQQAPVTLHYVAATGGFEYSIYGLLGSAADLGLVVEYMYDERGARAGHPLEQDIFLGGRIAANDVHGMTVLGGVVVDIDENAQFLNVEASRRLSGSTRLALELRAFAHVPARDPLAAIANDDHLQLEFTYFF